MFFLQLAGNSEGYNHKARLWYWECCAEGVQAPRKVFWCEGMFAGIWQGGGIPLDVKGCPRESLEVLIVKMDEGEPILLLDFNLNNLHVGR